MLAFTPGTPNWLLMFAAGATGLVLELAVLPAKGIWLGAQEARRMTGASKRYVAFMRVILSNLFRKAKYFLPDCRLCL